MKKLLIFLFIGLMVVGCSKKEFSINEILTTEKWEFKFYDNFEFGKSKHNNVDIVKVNVDITNNSGESDYVPFYDVYAPNGEEADNQSIWYENDKSLFYYGTTKIRDGITTNSFFVFDYKGDGDYIVEFDNGEKMTLHIVK